MKLGLYPGCSLTGSSREYNESVVAVANAAGLTLEEIQDWNCCGASAAHNLNHDLALALPARILAQAEKQNLTEILTPCAACYNRLAMTRHELLADAALRQRMSDVLEMPITASAKIVNVIEMMQRITQDDFASKMKQPFAYKVACYYGCLLVRPHKILGFDRCEDPQTMDEIMKKIGATPIDWPFKMECCGAGLSVSRTETVVRLASLIVEDAFDRGAQAIIVGCPMCHVNLDMRRPLIEKHLGKKIDIPVLYLSQAVGLALGIDPKTLGLHRHKVAVRLPLESHNTQAQQETEPAETIQPGKE